jgi:hypothetical protein
MCRNGIFVTIIFLGSCLTVLPANADQSALRERLRRPVSLHWEGVPLRPGLGRLAAAQNVDIFLDRRVDPGQKISASFTDIAFEDVLRQVAAMLSPVGGVTYVDGLVYIGPTVRARTLRQISVLRKRDASSLPTAARKKLRGIKTVEWSRLTEPRAFVAELCRARDVDVARLELIPHDLWAAGRLPAMPFTDQLTVLLAGFDLTFRPIAGGRRIELIPISSDQRIAADVTDESTAPSRSPRHTSRPRREERGRRAGEKVYTLRVINQPVGTVVRQLAARLDLTVEFDQVAIDAAGISLSELVSFEAEQASLDEMLEAVVSPAGLAFERRGKKVRIYPASDR